MQFPGLGISTISKEKIKIKIRHDHSKLLTYDFSLNFYVDNFVENWYSKNILKMKNLRKKKEKRKKNS